MGALHPGTPAVTRLGARREAGSAGTLELVLVTPLFLLVAMFIAEVGRIGAARTHVAYAAHAAARAAAEVTAFDAAPRAQAVAEATLASEHTTCAALHVVVDTSDLLPAGTAKVSVECTASFADLGPLHLPNVTVTSSAVEVVDTIRGGG